MDTRSDKYHRRMFLIAAIFNFTVAVVFGCFPDVTFPLLQMQPPANPAFFHLFMVLVLVFGIGYYMISLNPEANRGIVLMGIIGKLSVVLLLGFHAAVGNLSWMFAALGTGDVLFSLLFIRFFVSTRLVSTSEVSQA